MTKEIKINNNLGLHARLCSAVASEAGKFEGNIFLCTKKYKIDAKSILGLLSLCLPTGSSVVIEADGEDAKTAIDHISNLLA